jgi:hypothetical protein
MWLTTDWTATVYWDVQVFLILPLLLSKHLPEAVSVEQRRLNMEEENEFCLVLQSRKLVAFLPCHANLYGA